MLKLFSRSRSIPLKELSMLIRAGHPLVRSLELTCGKDHAHIILSVENGTSFADSVSKDLPVTAVSFIRAGEESGKLGDGIYAAWKSIESARTVKKKLVNSLAYPVFILATCFAALTIFSSIVLPSFISTLLYSGAKLPLLSKVVVIFGYNLQFIIPGLIILSFLFIRFSFGDGGFHLPFIGRLKKKLVLSSFFRVMSTALSSGTGLVEALKLSASTANSKLFRDKLSMVIALVMEGKEFSVSLKSTGFFDDTSISLIMAGERSSSLSAVFEQLAGMYEEGVEDNIKMALNIVEPASTLIVGLVVGIIVLAMFLPMIQLVGALGG